MAAPPPPPPPPPKSGSEISPPQRTPITFSHQRSGAPPHQRPGPSYMPPAPVRYGMPTMPPHSMFGQPQYPPSSTSGFPSSENTTPNLGYRPLAPKRQRTNGSISRIPKPPPPGMGHGPPQIGTPFSQMTSTQQQPNLGYSPYQASAFAHQPNTLVMSNAIGAPGMPNAPIAPATAQGAGQNRTFNQMPDYQIPRPRRPLMCGDIEVTDLSGPSENQRLVQEHYNTQSRVPIDRAQRGKSRIIHLRHFNNWVKSVLIDHHLVAIEKEANVLDVCGGKFGDLPKWLKASQSGKVKHVTLIDHAWDSIREAAKRYNENFKMYQDYQKDKEANQRKGIREPEKPFSVDMIVADCFRAKLDDVLPKNLYFDIISSQFSMHYCFENEGRARAFLQNVADRLKTEGLFIATIPDANVLVKMFRESCKPDSKFRKHRENDSTVVFGNEFYTVEFIGRTDQDTAFPETQPFGIKYLFQLDDVIDDCIEFLVHIPTLKRLARSYKLKLREKLNFEQLYEKIIRTSKHSEYQDLLNKMVLRQLKGVNTFPPKLWEVAHLYQFVVFEKTSTEEVKSSYEKDPAPVELKDIKVVLDENEPDPMELEKELNGEMSQPEEEDEDSFGGSDMD